MAQDDASQPAGHGERGSAATRDGGRTRTGLVVDDDPVIRRFVGDVLGREGFTVLEAPDGRTAISRLFERGGRLDLLLTDLAMPDMTGLELAAIVRDARPENALVLMTGEPSALVGVAVPGPVLDKPFSVDELLIAVAVALAARR